MYLICCDVIYWVCQTSFVVCFEELPVDVASSKDAHGVVDLPYVCINR